MAKDQQVVEQHIQHHGTAAGIHRQPRLAGRPQQRGVEQGHHLRQVTDRHQLDEARALAEQLRILAEPAHRLLWPAADRQRQRPGQQQTQRQAKAEQRRDAVTLATPPELGGVDRHARSQTVEHHGDDRRQLGTDPGSGDGHHPQLADHQLVGHRQHRHDDTLYRHRKGDLPQLLAERFIPEHLSLLEGTPIWPNDYS